MPFTQEQAIQLLRLLGEGKLISELTELLNLDTDNNFVAINSGSNDAKKIKIPLLRGYKGTYNANTNNPDLVNGSGLNGDMYVVSVAGSRDFGAGTVNLLVDDIIIYLNGKFLKTNGIVTGSLDLQGAYDNSSPKTITVADSSDGAITVKDSATNDKRDQILEVQDTGGNNLFYVRRDRVYIKENVGIGTESLSEKLEVNGNVKITGDQTINGKLEVNHDSFDTLSLKRNATGSATILMENSVQKGATIQSRGDGGLDLSTFLSGQNTLALRIDENQNVLIGTEQNISDSVLTVKNQTTESSENVTQFIDLTRSNASTSTESTYAQVVRVQSDSDQQDNVVIASNFVSRKKGSNNINGHFAVYCQAEYDDNAEGNVDFLVAVNTESTITGSDNNIGTVNYVRGVSTQVNVESDNTAVNYAQAAHLSVGIGGGATVGDVEVLLVDFDKLDTSTVAVTGDLSYIKIQADDNQFQDLTVTGTAYAILSNSKFKSYLAGRLELGDVLKFKETSRTYAELPDSNSAEVGMISYISDADGASSDFVWRGEASSTTTEANKRAALVFYDGSKWIYH